MREKIVLVLSIIILIGGPLVLGRAYFRLANESNFFIEASDLIFDESEFEITAAENHNQNPRLANLFYRWHIEEEEVSKLARYDILIIDMEVQNYSPDKLKRIRDLNPDIILLAYLAPEEIRGDSGSLTGTLRKKLFDQIHQDWWLYDDSGNRVSWWPSNPMINITNDAPSRNGEKWSQVLATFVKNELIDKGYWDGVFYDNIWENLTFMSDLNIDTDRNGKKESISDLNRKWQLGMEMILSKTRQYLGPNKYIFGNGGEFYVSYLNGVLYETFPQKGWATTLDKYRYVNDNGRSPSAGIINTNVNNSGNQSDFQKMRFGFASTMLDDGYYSFDNGDGSHHETWWYDEYEVSLGESAGEAFNVIDNSSDFKPGVWRRDFKNGLVIVNSTGQNQRVDLGGEYEKIHGTQDTIINDGSFVTAVTVRPSDGLILLRPIDRILDSTYVNGSFARVYNQFGHVARSGFFAYEEDYRGGNQIIERDLDGDGSREFVVADINKVEIFNNQGQNIKTFYPYTERYNQGVNITVGDLDNNGTLEIITGTENGGGPHVRIFNHKGELINPGFFAYADNFRGGVNITVGDLEGDGYKEIIAGAGVGGGPHVRVFAADGRLINPGFFAFDKTFRGGVNVAAGDIDGDGVDEIIAGPGKGGGPQIRAFDRNGNLDGPEFFAFDKNLRDGVEVVVSDMDSDGVAEIIATTSDVFTLFNYVED